MANLLWLFHPECNHLLSAFDHECVRLECIGKQSYVFSHAHGSTAPLACVRLHLVLSPLAGCGGSLSIHAFFRD